MIERAHRGRLGDEGSVDLSFDEFRRRENRQARPGKEFVLLLGGVIGDKVDEVGDAHEIGERAGKMARTKEGDRTLLRAHAL